MASISNISHFDVASQPKWNRVVKCPKQRRPTPNVSGNEFRLFSQCGLPLAVSISLRLVHDIAKPSQLLYSAHNTCFYTFSLELTWTYYMYLCCRSNGCVWCAASRRPHSYTREYHMIYDVRQRLHISTVRSIDGSHAHTTQMRWNPFGCWMCVWMKRQPYAVHTACDARRARMQTHTSKRR